MLDINDRSLVSVVKSLLVRANGGRVDYMVDVGHDGPHAVACIRGVDKAGPKYGRDARVALRNIDLRDLVGSPSVWRDPADIVNAISDRVADAVREISNDLAPVRHAFRIGKKAKLRVIPDAWAGH